MFLTILVKIFKNIVHFNFEKTIPRVVSLHDFQAILAFLNQNYFFSLSQKFLTKKVIFCHFLKKSAFLVKIWYQKRIRWLISIPEMYTFNSLKVTALDMFQKNVGSHPPLRS